MPARVHAILVVRPDGRTPATLHLKRTLAALDDQQRRIDALTVVLCGPDKALTEMATASGADMVITAPAHTRFAAAAAMATPGLTGDAVWLLAQDTAPETDALTRLAGALELAPSVAFVAPKLVRWDDRTQIVSLGVSMTTLGRAVGMADGQLDQGQHDAVEDILAADVRGLLVRTDAWRELGGLDPALVGADEGLDLGIRARLAGARISLVPSALVAVAGDGVAGMPSLLSPQRERRRAFAERTAQLHRRLAYAHPLALPFVWLALLPTALVRTVLHLVAKHPSLVGVEWAASAVAFVRVGAIGRSRARIRAARRTPWTQIAPLRVTRAQLHERFDGDSDGGANEGPDTRGELRFFAGGGAWLVLAALVVSIVAFPALLAWPVLGGGALEPLRATVAQLWGDAAYGLRATGLATIGPADPFAAVIAVVGSLWPGDPSRAMVLLWLAALPLAALGGWFVATRVTARPLLRITGGVLWMLAPTFLAALSQGRPTGVLVHLLLPWLFYAGSVAHRSWAAAGAASLLFAAVVACAPSLAPALLILWLIAVILAVALRGGRGVSRLIWLLVPAIAAFAPLVWTRIRSGSFWELLADPGVVWAGPQVAADPAGRALLAAGFPTPDLGGWTVLLGQMALPVWWVPLLVAPVAVLALAAALTQRWLAGVVLLVVAAVGIGTAFAAVGIAVSFDQSEVVALWPGAGLSLAWLGVVGGALVALDTGFAPRLAIARSATAFLVMVAIVVLAVPALDRMVGVDPDVDETASVLTNGPRSTLPAYVAAEGRENQDVGTITLTPQNEGGVATRIVWGGSETIGSWSTISSTRTSPTAQDHEVAALTADLVTTSADNVVERLAAAGVRFVLLAPADAPESSAARALRLSAATALNQRDGLDAVGETSKGDLWRVTQPIEPRAQAEASVRDLARWIAIAQLAVIAAALLLAVPTRASRREARRASRIVGPYWQEGR
ncbi:glycosyl transferase [Microbacterium sp. Root61]|uniref:glycosyltransferase n=1 Tax=Microbacterium sp. Root61 TaxID=1736570 RepID=UPI0006F62DE1|nr:glycosyltransferase [Microbacterium sp. Root61]KRA22254.1 glycosyl transferase [Microbacterium sp. Root61]